MSWVIRRTKFGLGLIAIREDEGKAGTVGVNAPVYKIIAFGASALFVGMAGGVYAYYLGFVDPINMFSILFSVQIVLSVILGGRGTLFGPVIGAFIIEPVNTFANSLAGGGNTRLVLFGGLLLVLVVLLPKGILPTLKALIEKARARGQVGLSGTRLTPLGKPLHPITVTERIETVVTPAPLLEVKGLAKAFGGNKAVDDCSFTVPEGSITALDRTERLGKDDGLQPRLRNVASGPWRNHPRGRAHRKPRPMGPRTQRDRADVPNHPSLQGDDGPREHRHPAPIVLARASWDSAR